MFNFFYYYFNENFQTKKHLFLFDLILEQRQINISIIKYLYRLNEGREGENNRHRGGETAE